MATLNLPQGVRATVWELVKTQLKADPTLQAAGVTLFFFEGDRNATTAMEAMPSPSIVFLATLARMAWFNERSQSGALLINYKAVVDTLDDTDILNLQETLETALYPADNNAFHQGLVNAGAVTGQPLFAQPLNQALAAAGTAGLFQPTGKIVLEVERGFTP